MTRSFRQRLARPLSALVAFVGCTLALLTMLAPSSATAGDRALEIVFINMTPDPVSDAQRECSARIRRGLRADYVHLRTMGESTVRAQLGDGDFMTWNRQGFETLRNDRTDRSYVDAFVLVDCSPASHFRALVVPAQGLSRIDVPSPTSEALQDALLARILRHAWTGFAP